MLFDTHVPSSVIARIGSVEIYGYGLMLAIGILAAYAVIWYLARLRESKEGGQYVKHCDHLFFLTLLAGFLCARLFFIFYHLGYFIEYPGEILAVWNGGLVWHGALIGGVGAVYLYCRIYTLMFLRIADTIVPGIALGQAIGRWGNYFNQEAYGLPISLPWGIPIDVAHRLPGYESFAYFHPTFLYESLASAVLFAVLFVFVRFIGATKKSGLLTAMYLVYYSTARFFIEFIRIDSVPITWGLRMPQLISLLILCIVLFGIIVHTAQRKRSHS